jgi:hypothetical protein
MDHAWRWASSSASRRRSSEDAAKPNRIKGQVTARQVLARTLTLQPPDPAAVLLGALGVNTSEVRRPAGSAWPGWAGGLR